MNWFVNDSITWLSFLGSLIIVFATFFVVGIYIKKMKEKGDKGDLSSKEWDGISEYKNQLPVGWAVIFIALTIWAIWYMLLGYPLNSYSQIGDYNEEVKAFNANFEKVNKDISKDQLKVLGEQVYLANCAACHGNYGSGNNGLGANLQIWGSEEGIIYTIKHGSKGLNFPFGEMPEGLVGDDDAIAVAAFIAKEISGIKKTAHENLINKGRDVFAANCAACHGEDGKGMDGSSPDLSIYGTPAFVKLVLERGKKGSLGFMPSFKDGRLNDIQKMAVSEYVISLSR